MTQKNIVTVVMYAMRHGERTPATAPGQEPADELTALGIQQVKRAAQNRLVDVTFDAAYYSGMNRAEQTVTEALVAIGMGDVVPKANEGFGYEWATKATGVNPEYLAVRPVEKAIGEACKAEGKKPMVADWLNSPWRPAWAIRGRFYQTLLDVAVSEAMDTEEGTDEVNVLIGSHSPTAELAAVDPSTMPRLGLADMVKYVVEVDIETGDAKLVSSEYLEAPPATT